MRVFPLDHAGPGDQDDDKKGQGFYEENGAARTVVKENKLSVKVYILHCNLFITRLPCHIEHRVNVHAHFWGNKNLEPLIALGSPF